MRNCSLILRHNKNMKIKNIKFNTITGSMHGIIQVQSSSFNTSIRTYNTTTNRNIKSNSNIMKSNITVSSRAQREQPTRRNKENECGNSNSNMKRQYATNSSSTAMHNSNRNINKKEVHKKRSMTEADIFGEPVTYILPSRTKEGAGTQQQEQNLAIKQNECSIAWDDYILSITTRGKASKDGGSAMGVQTQAAHSFGITWGKLLASVLELDTYKRELQLSVPLLTVGCVLPLLCIGGVPYLKYVDDLICGGTGRGETGRGGSLLSLLQDTIQQQEGEQVLTQREQYYIECAQHLLRNESEKALHTLIEVITYAPGDIFAISLLMELSSTAGNTRIPLRASGIVASYLAERQNTHIGATLGLSYVSLGFAVGGRYKEAEIYADLALRASKFKNQKLLTPTTALSLAILYDAEGRIEEGISLLYNYDGMDQYNMCGYFFYDAYLSCYSTMLFYANREGYGSDGTINNCLRLYNDYFTRIFDYSGFSSQEEDWVHPVHDVPIPRYQEILKDAASSTTDLLSWFSFTNEVENEKTTPTTPTKQVTKATTLQDQKRQLEDTIIQIVTYLPPTPQVLSHATIILLRLTLASDSNASEDTPVDENRNDLWKDLHTAWKRLFLMYNQNSNQKNDPHHPMSFCPLAQLLSSLFLDPKSFQKDYSENELLLLEAFHLIGSLLKLPQYTISEDTMDENSAFLVPKLPNAMEYTREEELALWNRVFTNLYQSTYLSKSPSIWEVQISSLLHFLLYYSCIQTTTQYPDNLYKARAICSEAIVLKPNNCEYWWHYSYVLKLLGDDVACEHANHVCRSLVSSSGGSGRFKQQFEDADDVDGVFLHQKGARE